MNFKIFTMKRILILGIFMLFNFYVKAETEARLLRFPTINQTDVVFTYAGDLYTVPHQGGIARKLTSHVGLEVFPKFSPDGTQVAFTGQYDGNTEVFIMPARGGEPQRLTYTATLGRDDLGDRMGPNNIVLGWTPDGQVVYRSRKQTFNDFKGQLFKVSSQGGLPQQIEVPEGGFLSFSPDGKKIAYNRVFREFRTWKYYRGGMADEIWIHDFETRTTEKITDNPAQDIQPMWIGDEIFFLSDRDRTMNLFVYNTRSKTTEKVTNYTDFDIKFPSNNGQFIVFEKGGYLYTLDARNREIKKISIYINNDLNYARHERIDASARIFSADLSPNGERVLFSARGDVYSVPAEKGITYQLTRTPGIHERRAQWSPDGKKMVWLSDQSGEYEIWISDVNGSTNPRMLSSGGDTYKFNMSWSPNSKLIAWNDQHYKLYITNTETGATRELAHSDYSRFSDFSWSPDSRWLAFSESGANRMDVIYVLNVETGQKEAITDEWYDSGQPAFSSDGKYLLFASARDFSPIYSNTEWNHAYVNMSKVYMVLLSKDTPSPFAPENATVKAVEPENDSKNTDDKKDDKKSGKNATDKSKPAETVNPVKIDFDGIASRIVELPVEAAGYGNISAVGKKVYFRRFVQGGKPGSGLIYFDLDKKKEENLGNYNYALSANNKKMLVGSGTNWTVVDLPSAPVKMDSKIDLGGLTTVVDYRQEWQQIFDEAWRQMRDFFYVENMHGVNWKEINDKYKPLIAHVNHRTDLNYIIGEMIGELNVGHAYVNPGDQPKPDRVLTGLLGARLSAHESGYFRIDKILEGASWDKALHSPLQAPGVKANVGDYIIAIDQIMLTEVKNPYQLLAGKANRVVEITVNSRPSAQGASKALITPIANESNLYYYNWVQNNISKVSEATNGQVGYVHVPDMGANGLNEFSKYFYPQLHKKALIIDDRGNGGGNVSPMLLERLSRVPYRVNMRRNSPVTTPLPAQTLVGPKITLIDKYSASDGDLFPFGFRELGLGKLVGTRTWGGIVGITGSLPFIDGTDLRIPQFTSLSMDGKWMIEGEGVSPDIEVENDPYKEFMGDDAQLGKAIELILEELKNRSELPVIPAPPVK
jgi:tricorn protease